MRKFDLVVLLVAAIALSAAGPAKPRAKASLPAKTNWNAVVTHTPQDTHILGNPAAPVRLTEFVSYTCSHCAHFEGEADAALRVGFVAQGKTAVEVRHFVRDPVDMTVALLTNCAPASKFFLNHTAFMRSQSKWIGPLASATPAQETRWFTGAFSLRTKNIAKDFGFYPIMATRGYTSAQVDKCLSDEALAGRLAADTDLAQQTLRISGTPSFAIDGAVLAGTHDWEALRPQLDARVRSGG